MPHIVPTVGRVVHFVPASYDSLYGPSVLTALVCYVHSDTMVNLAVFDANGGHYARTSIYLEQEGGEPGINHGSYCRWMVYQQGQAAKAEKAESELEAVRIAKHFPPLI